MDIYGIVEEPFVQRVALSVLCGSIIGIERQLRGKVAGVRTSALICLGTHVFVWLGVTTQGPVADPTRVLGQVVTGVGFLGAGVILARGGTVVGVTTAAVVWMLAAIGSCIGLDQYAAAFGLTLTTVAVLTVVQLIETGIRRIAGHADTSDSIED